jgi:hypothetical protein
VGLAISHTERMLRLLILFVSAMLLVGCGRKIEEKDLVGTWNVDPASVAGKDPNDLMSKMSFNLTANHQYTMSGPVPLSIKGSWVYSDGKLTLAPTTVVVSTGANQNSELPISSLMQMQPMTQDEKMKTSLNTMNEQVSFDVSTDGKKLSDAGKPALIKAE